MCVFVQVWALSHKSICSRLYIPCCVCFLIFSQGWKPLWVLWSSQWRSCQMWWFWLCSVWVYLPSSVYSCLWVIFGKSVSSGQSIVLKPTWPMGARALTSMNTSWMTVSRQSSDYLGQLLIQLLISVLLFLYFLYFCNKFDCLYSTVSTNKFLHPFHKRQKNKQTINCVVWWFLSMVFMFYKYLFLFQQTSTSCQACWMRCYVETAQIQGEEQTHNMHTIKLAKMV